MGYNGKRIGRGLPEEGLCRVEFLGIFHRLEDRGKGEPGPLDERRWRRLLEPWGGVRAALWDGLRR